MPNNLLSALTLVLLLSARCGTPPPEHYGAEFILRIVNDTTVQINERVVDYNTYNTFIDSLGRAPNEDVVRVQLLYDDRVTVRGVRRAKLPIRHHNRKFEVVYEDGILVRLPPWSDDQPDVTALKPRNVFPIGLISNDSMLVDTVILAVQQKGLLYGALVRFLYSDPDDESMPELSDNGVMGDAGPLYYRNRQIIVLEANEEIRHSVYDSVYAVCNDAYYSVLNRLSNEYKSKPFSELDTRQQQVMRQILPRVIAEAETNHFIKQVQKSPGKN